MDAKQNMYLFKALDAYPYDLEQAIEALEYALSYEPENAQALFLMGRVYSEQLQDFETAKNYFAEAMAQDMALPRLYVYYTYVLIANEDFEEASKLLEFAKTRKGLDQAQMHYLEGLIYEHKTDFKRAKRAYKLAKLLSVNNSFRGYLTSELDRIKDKQPKKKTNKKKKKKSKNNKKKGEK